MSDSSRRSFLKLAGAAAAAPVLAQLSAARRAVAEEIQQSQPFSFRLARDAYTLDPEITYLNHASIGTIPRMVQDARRRYLELCEENPWLYMWSGEWNEPREEVRAKAAKLLGASPEDVAITHNTTETFSLLAAGLPLGRGDEVLYSSLNHDGASVAFKHQAAVRGYTVRRFDFPVLDAPRLDRDEILDLYDRQIGRRTRLLVLPQIDNMVGLRHPVRELAALARSKGVEWVAVDGAQAAGMIPLDVAGLGVDVYATSAHKWIQAPKGLGLAHLGEAVRQVLLPQWMTWGQERFRGTVRAFEDYGTRNLPEVLALGDALDFQDILGADAKEAHHRRLWEHGRRLVDQHPKLRWRSPTSWELSAALWAVEVDGETSRDVSKRLFSEHGFVFRPFSTQGLETLRLSPNVRSTTDDLDRLATALA